MDKTQFMLNHNACIYNPYAYVINDNPMMHVNISSSLIGNSRNPDIFGPPLWFVLHNAATCYAKRPNAFTRQGMKQLLTNLHQLVPCNTCKEHFHDWLLETNLDDVVSSKEKLFAFFVDTHNYVNRRYGKPEMSVKAAKELYGFDKPTGTNIRITYT